MPVKRLGSLTPAAFNGTDFALLATSDVTCVASVIAVNKGAIPALVTIAVEPFDTPGSFFSWSHIVKDLEIGVGQSFETFRVALTVGDKIYISADTADINFNVTAAYEQAGRTNVLYQPNQPGFPSVGDIWIDSDDDDSIKLFNGAAFNTIATAAPVGPTGPAGTSGGLGPTGPTGAEGSGVSVLGAYATEEALLLDNESGNTGDAYIVGQDIYFWSALNEEWANGGQFLGATGPTGATGAASTVAGPTVVQNFQVGNNGSSAYVIDGNSNPTLTLVRGKTYFFTVNASGHPFWIQTTGAGYSSGNVYNTGVTNNGEDMDGIQFTIDAGAPSTLYYQCQNHLAMVGTINIIGEGSTTGDDPTP